MQEPKKPLLQLRTVVDIALGASCILLLFFMLGQLDSLKKLEGDMDRLRAQVEAQKIDQRPADKALNSVPAANQGK